MCGIAGFWQLIPSASGSDEVAIQAERMADHLAHRGPDDAGVWRDPDMPIALAHRRLSIVDLSPEGHQPMVSADGRYVIVFNGEIYNFRELRAELSHAGYPFRGHCDTEVLLAAIDRWGLAATLPRLNGMFAFALWDCAAQRLQLVRDRLGKKPLYFGRVHDSFVFASELGALKALTVFSGVVDRESVALYLRFGYVPAPRSIYQGIYKLDPGSVLTLDRDQARAGFDYGQYIQSFWSAVDAARNGLANPLAMDDETATDTLQSLLRDATVQRMEADVPVGAFLSGGIDSSLIVALMQEQASVPVHTFSLGFEGYANNETPHARAIADYLGTQHSEIHLSRQEVIDTVPRIPDIVDEPLADFAQVPNYLVAALARPSVKVVLTGDGGDELFCGYDRQMSTAAHWRQLQRLPLALRRLACATLNRFGTNGEHSKATKSGARIGARSIDELYFYKMSQWMEPGRVVLGAEEPVTEFANGNKWPEMVDPVQRTLLLEQVFHLTDVILAKVDRTSMASGLEVRSPLLDYRVAEWAWRLPMDMKVRGDQAKWILRSLLARYVPRSLFERPKQGFGAPIGQWLGGPLSEWAEDLLSTERLQRQGLLDPEPVRQLWEAQRAGGNYGKKSVWNVLMLQAWLDRHATASLR
ncbi:MAG: asparagine synthase (glutamine-hydrolyzing) [Bacteroidetes bacterium]|jgi:asparagine synthase (glutamine-hydrolysing)|nr:asparagine synthase (glutamine-hydrolyzing) [Bacteroidota bacterium]